MIFIAELYNHNKPMVPKLAHFDSPEALHHIIVEG
jgi:hypothetical protein